MAFSRTVSSISAIWRKGVVAEILACENSRSLLGWHRRSSPGLASLVAFRGHASTVLHLAGDNEDDTQDLLIGKLAKIILDEVKQTDHDQSRYDIRISKEDIAMSVSQTVMDLLAALSNTFNNTLPALLIGNIITYVLSNKPTNLQISLGNLIRDSKSLINQL